MRSRVPIACPGRPGNQNLGGTGWNSRHGITLQDWTAGRGAFAIFAVSLSSHGVLVSSEQRVAADRPWLIWQSVGGWELVVPRQADEPEQSVCIFAIPTSEQAARQPGRPQIPNHIAR